MYERKIPLKKTSAIDITFYVVGGKWKRDIIFCIHSGLRRPSELQRHLAKVCASPRVLRQQLRELDHYGIIYKKVHTFLPVKVEYFLTDIGLELIPLFSEMEKWGTRYEKIYKMAKNSYVDDSKAEIVTDNSLEG